MKKKNKNSSFLDENIMQEYQILQEDFIFIDINDYKILNVTKDNFNTIFKKNTEYTFLNYYNTIKYFLYEFIYNYNSNNIYINDLKTLLKNDITNPKLNAIDFIIEDQYLFKKFIKKFYPFNHGFDLYSSNLNLINHIYIHKEKIFNINNIVELIKKSYRNICTNSCQLVIDHINSGIIKGISSKLCTIQEIEYGIDYWLINTNNDEKMAVKYIEFNENSEFHLNTLDNNIKLMIYNIESNINNYSKGVNTMKYKFINILLNNKMLFLNTHIIQDIVNNRIDKYISITFNKSYVAEKDDLKKFIKQYKIDNYN